MMTKREIRKVATKIKHMSVNDIYILVKMLIDFEEKGNYVAYGLYQNIRLEKDENKTEEDARYEFNSLLNDDYDFKVQWGHKSDKQQEKAFYEWCSMNDDLKHIKRKKTNESYSL